MLVALASGAMLGLAGALFQTVTRNNLVDPGLIGVAAGSVLASSLALTYLPFILSLGPTLPLVALVGGCGSGILVYRIAGAHSPVRLALTGVLVSAGLSSITALTQLQHSRQIASILLWTIGSLNGSAWLHWQLLWPWALGTIVLGFASAGICNALPFGDDVAASLGLNAARARALLFFIGALLTAAAVSIVGNIAFVGLVAPNAARRLLNSDARYVLPLSACLGAALVLFADAASQAFNESADLPVGSMVALIGAPTFAWLVLQR
jgi:iron complex transport system permease protein